MGSSRPTLWDKQSSSRKEISRLLEIKSKTIAFVKRWSFFVLMGYSPHLSIYENQSPAPGANQLKKKE